MDALNHPHSANKAVASGGFRAVAWLSAASVAWMLLEAAVAGLAAWRSHSVALLAFASDSVVELLSAAVVVLPWISGRWRQQSADRAAGLLLWVLAGVVTVLAAASLWGLTEPKPSRLGVAVTLAALVIMPALAWFKRREAGRSGNRALAADAAQSATCAWLALLTLLGLVLHGWLGWRWVDPAAAIAAVPLLVREGMEARAGRGCHCLGE